MMGNSSESFQGLAVRLGFGLAFPSSQFHWGFVSWGTMKFLLVFIGLAILLGLGAGAWQLGYFQVAGSEEIPFTVQKGDNFAVLARRLEKEGIIRSERALRWYVNLASPSKSLKRGEFGLFRNMSVPAVVQALTEGRPMEYKVTVPEGHNLFQVADILAAKGLATREDFLAAARDPEVVRMLPTLAGSAKLPRSIEGYIFPDTYHLQKVFTAKEIAQLMVARFREVFQGLSAEMENSVVMRSLGLNPHELVILASIVEKETGAAQERPLIASVFINRLRKKMRLQTDPTVIYGVWVAQGNWDGNIRRRDLNTPTEYNTYQMSGLPVGPIANPGINAIRAVLQPAESDYLFFVSRNNGTHIFSKDFSAHNRAVRETQLNPGAREGKSWRDLPAEQRAR